MTDRPFAGGKDTAVGPTPGYYPDPSVPGFVRYWGGTAWVPGSSRPAPAEGEVLEPPRFVARRSGAAGAAGAGVGARYAPPPVAPDAVAPVVDAAEVAEVGAGGGVSPADGVDPVDPVGAVDAGGGVDAAAVAERAPEPLPGETGPVYLDQTAGGASFTLGPQLAGGPVFRPAGAEGEAEGWSGATGEDPSGWQVDPRAQRGLMDTGGAPRWVSWGVLPGVEPAAEAGDPVAAQAVEPVGGPAVADAEVVPVPVPVALRAAVPVPAPGAEPGWEPRSAPRPAPGSAPEPEPESEPVVEPEPVPVQGAANAPAPAPVPATRPMRTVPAGRTVPAARPASAASAPRPAARRRPAPPVPAGLGRRLAARLVDTVVLAVVAIAAAIPLGSSVQTHLQDKLDQARMASSLTRRQVDVWLVDGVVVGKFAVLVGILAFVGLLYEVLPTARTGQTFGKRLARIKVIDAAPSAARVRLTFGRSLCRWLVRNVSAVLLLGLVWPVFDRPARRGWHDRAGRTRVVRA
ncbi:RDD family protein [Kitasatospora sp. NPDC050467]|uniref:RDD family protein n=1 Tax=Kitasatospora sp. NPDC050467 TaxID=3364053 RepID=UPI0037876CE2